MIQTIPTAWKRLSCLGLAVSLSTSLVAAEKPAPATSAPLTSAVAPAENLPSEAEDAEIIRERYANGTIKIERHVAQDAQGNYFNHGPWTTWNEQGQLMGGGEYKNGKRHGQWIRLYSGEEEIVSGKHAKQFKAPFRAEATFDNGRLNGVWTVVDAANRPVLSWSFENGQRHGKSVTFHPNGEKWQEVDYVKGQFDGEVTEWAADRTVIAKASYRMGRRVEEKLEFHAPGVKKLSGQVLLAKEVLEITEDFWTGANHTRFAGKEGSDLKTGVWMAWHKNGQKAMEGAYENDLPKGKFTWWHSNGQKALTGEYIEGLQDGRWVWWYENGQKHIDGHYIAGHLNGSWNWWNLEGRVIETATYTDKDVTPNVALQPNLVPDFDTAKPQLAEPRPVAVATDKPTKAPPRGEVRTAQQQPTLAPVRK